MVNIGSLGKVESMNFTDLLLTGLVKSVEERMLTKIVGNGNFFSGAVKLGIGAVMPSNGMLKVGKNAFVIDGAEDIVNALTGMTGLGTMTSTEAPFSVL